MINKIFAAGKGKVAAAKTAGSKIVGQSSGAMANSSTAQRVKNYAINKPVKSTATGIGGLGAAGYVVSGRRGRGTGRVSGRPTGIRRY